MADDEKLTQKTENSSPIGTDIFGMVDDPGGTPLSQKITFTNAFETTLITAAVGPASTSAAGKIEIATAAEVDTGTDTTRAMGVAEFVASKRNIRYLMFILVAPTTSVSADTDLGGDFTIPFAGTILQDDTLHDQLAAITDTAGITGTMVVDIHLNGTTIMTTNKLDILTTEKGSQTNGTQPDLTTTAITAGDILTFDIDAVHSGTAAKGLKILMAIRES